MVRKPPSKLPEEAAGLSAFLLQMSRGRRQTFQKLTEISTHVLAAPRRNDLLPPLQLISIPVSSLKAASRRVRKSEPAQKARIEASTTRFGYCDPILIDQHNTIIDGHLRWEMAKERGWAEIPVSASIILRIPKSGCCGSRSIASASEAPGPPTT